MKQVGIAIDSWKLPIFDKHLRRAGIAYDVCNGLTEDTRLLTANVERIADAQPIVEAANAECRRRQRGSK